MERPRIVVDRRVHKFRFKRSRCILFSPRDLSSRARHDVAQKERETFVPFLASAYRERMVVGSVAKKGDPAVISVEKKASSCSGNPLRGIHSRRGSLRSIPLIRWRSLPSSWSIGGSPPLPRSRSEMKSNFTPAIWLMGRKMGGKKGSNRRGKNERKYKREKKGRGRRNTHSVGEHHRFYVTQTSSYTDIANPPPSYGPLDRHALPRNHGKMGGGEKKKWRWNRWRRKSRSCLSIGTFFITRSYPLPFSRVGVGLRWNQEGVTTFFASFLKRNCLLRWAIRKDRKYEEIIINLGGQFSTINRNELIEFRGEFDQLWRVTGRNGKEEKLISSATWFVVENKFPRV